MSLEFYTYFFPRLIMPYITPQQNTNPQAKILPKPGQRITGMTAILEEK
jgi:hypothetical protein